VVVHLDEENPFAPVEAAALIGRTVRFSSPKGATAHTIKEAVLDGRDLTLTTQDDVLVGRLRVGVVHGKTVETPTRLVFAPSYAGTTALDDKFNRVGLVQSADQDRIELAFAPEKGQAEPGSDLWLSSVGPGDRLDAPYMFEWQRE
jgi:hypothetical protein